MKTLKTFTFTNGGARGYDWDTLLDGGIYQMKEGEDYICKAETVKFLAKARAKTKGLTVQVQKIEGGLVLQASGHAEGETEGAE